MGNMILTFGVFIIMTIFLKTQKLMQDHGEDYIGHIPIPELMKMRFDTLVGLTCIFFGSMPGIP